jgi:hypothetical protein
MFGLDAATAQLYDCTFKIRRKETTNSRDLRWRVNLMTVLMFNCGRSARAKSEF